MIFLLVILGLILIIFTWWKPKWMVFFTLALIPFHAFLITYFSDILALQGSEKIFLASWKELILIILALKVVWRAYIGRQFPFKILLVDKLIFALFILSLITFAALKIDLIVGIWGLRYDFELFIIYFVIRSFSWSKDEIIKAIKIILISGILVAIFTLIQAWFLPKDFLVHFGYSDEILWSPKKPIPAFQEIGGSGIIRSQSFLAGPNQLGSYLLVLLSLVLGICIFKKALKWKVVFTLLGILFAIALFYTYSRSGWVGFGALFVVWSFIWAGKKHWLKVAGAYVGLLILVLVLVKTGVFGGNFNDVYLQHQGSTPERIERVKDAFVEIIKHPVGIGIGQAGLVTTRFSDGQLIPENWYLQIGLELGILGLLIYIGIIIEFFRQLWIKLKTVTKNIDKKIALSALIGFVGLSVYGLFLHVWSDISTTFVSWFLMGLVFASMPEILENSKENNKSSKDQKTENTKVSKEEAKSN